MRAGTLISCVSLLVTVLLLGEMNARNIATKNDEKENEDLTNLIREITTGNKNLNVLDLVNYSNGKNSLAKLSDNQDGDEDEEEMKCGPGNDCKNPGTTECKNEKCACKAGFETPSGNGLDVSCTEIINCTISATGDDCEETGNTECKNDKCVCKNGFEKPTGNGLNVSCTVPVVLEQECNATDKCEGNHTKCGNEYKCACESDKHQPVVGTSGKNLVCELVDLCKSVQCKGLNTMCDKDTGECECLDGYKNKTGSNDTLECEYECKAGDCGENNKTICIPNKSRFICKCLEGQYFDYVKKICKATSQCVIPGCSNAKNNSMCDLVTQTCVCPCGFRENTEKHCEEIEPPKGPKEATCKPKGCVKTEQDFECTCPTGYKLSDNKKKCLLISCDLKSAYNCSEDCVLDETKDQGFKCVCYNGTEVEPGVQCSTNFNDTCVDCGNGGNCLVQGDKVVCKCKNNFVGIDGKCLDKCAANETESTNCGYCKSTDDEDFGYECLACANGFKKLDASKTVCIPKDPCKDDIKGVKGDDECAKQNKGTCKPDPNNSTEFTCEGCANGFEMDKNNICQDTCVNAKCAEKKALCVKDGQGKASCQCPALFYMNEVDKKCKAAQTSLIYNLPGLDIDTPTNYVANSESMYNYESVFYADNIPKATAQIILDALQNVNEEVTDVKILETKTDGVTVVEVVFKSKINTDSEKTIFQKLDCQKKDDNTCVVPPLLVVKNKDAFVKALEAPEQGKAFENPCETLINPCTGKGQKCATDQTDYPYHCECKVEGYENKGEDISKAYKSEICEDINECDDDSKCNNAVCMNLSPEKGKYFCKCNDTYKNQPNTTEDCIEVCSDIDCKNGKCEPRGNHFLCDCQAGYFGEFCQHAPAPTPKPVKSEDKELATAETNVIVVGAVLGAVLLLSIIVSAVIIRKLRGKLNKSGGNNQAMDELNSGRRGYDNPAGPR